jgi:menaquinone-9 beta-reductase
MRAPLVIGGGPAGATAAAVIAGAGREVMLIERNSGAADKVCGDFLSDGAMTALAELDVDPLSLGAVSVTTLRIVRGRNLAETMLPFAATGLSRRVLDEALLGSAAARGARVLRGQVVSCLEPNQTGFLVTTATMGTLNPDSVFIATGKHNLRGVPRPTPGAGLLGLKMYYMLTSEQWRALHGAVELVLFHGGYAGLQLVERGRAVLCLLVPSARWRSAGGRWDTLLHSLGRDAPHLRTRLGGATPCLERPLAIARLPYGYLCQSGTPALRAERSGRVFRVGDQACVVPSIAGDGVAVALHSARLAAEIWLGGGNANGYEDGLVREFRARLRLASVIHHGCRVSAAQAAFMTVCRAVPAAMRVAATMSRLVVRTSYSASRGPITSSTTA